MKKIGIFAGSFDPIHDGHIAVAEAAVHSLDLDEVKILIETVPWGGKTPAPISCREDMVRLAIDHTKKLSLHSMNDQHFSIEKTLPKIERDFVNCELFFIFGADVFMFMNATQWPGLEKLLKHQLAIFERGEITELQLSDHAKKLGIAIALLPSSFPHHSSTLVRKLGGNRKLLLPGSVYEYIVTHELYAE